MKEYLYSEDHSRVYFSARETLVLRHYLAQCESKHPVFTSIRDKFTTATGSVNISTKQRDVIAKTLCKEYQAIALDTFLQSWPLGHRLQTSATKEAVVKAALLYLGGGGYGDWTHTTELEQLRPGMQASEVVASDGVIYLCFQAQEDMETLSVVIEGGV